MPVKFFNDFEQEKFKYKGQEIELHVKRSGQVIALRGTVPEDGILGFRPEILLNTAHYKYSLPEAVPIGTAKAFTTVWVNIKGLVSIYLTKPVVHASGGLVRLAGCFAGMQGGRPTQLYYRHQPGGRPRLRAGGRCSCYQAHRSPVGKPDALRLCGSSERPAGI